MIYEKIRTDYNTDVYERKQGKNQNTLRIRQYIIIMLKATDKKTKFATN